ncbi:MAG TPA: Rieske 2Fe-2S domain-containing protein [Xanthobacteraceae bacterium]
MAWHKIASIDAIPDGGILGVELAGTPVALYRMAGEVLATQGTCTHAFALLADGIVEDGKVECPLHQALFDVRTGEALAGPAIEDLRTYAVKVEAGEVFVNLERAAESAAADLLLSGNAGEGGPRGPAGGAGDRDAEAPSAAATQGGERGGMIPAETEDRRSPGGDAPSGRPDPPVPGRRGPVASAEAAAAAPGSSGAAAQPYVWPQEGLTRIPDWVYTDPEIYAREVERIFHGRTWNYVALECEIPNGGDYIRSHVGPTPVVVARARDATIHVFENRCVHRAAEFCRELSGNTNEFVCPYHQWTYDLAGNLIGVPFRRGVAGRGGMPADFDLRRHGPRRLSVTAHRGVVFASYAPDMEPLQDYLGKDVLAEFEATFDGRRPKLLGYYRHTLPGNWKLYHENLKDPYHATLLHTFLVTFGLLVAGNRSLMLADPSGRHGVMASAKSDAKTIAGDAKKEMRAYREGMTLAEPRFMDFVDEFDSPWSVTMLTIWPNLIVQREMNTLGVRQIVPTGPHEFIMKWTMFGFEGDDEEMTRHRLRQGNLMGPAGFLGLEDNEAIKFVQDGMQRVPGGEHLVKLDPSAVAGTSDSLISEAAIRAMYSHWRSAMGL